MDFGDDGTTIVPFSRIVGGSTEKGRCSVKWADGKQYNAHPLITNEGTYFLLNAHMHVVHGNNGYVRMYKGTIAFVRRIGHRPTCSHYCM